MKLIPTKFRIIIGFRWGVPILIFGVLEPISRLIIDIDGTVISRRIKCKHPPDYRCVTTYKIQSSNNSCLTIYMAGPNDHSLAQNIEVGSNIKKAVWDLGYYVDGEYRKDFPIIFYIVIITIGFFVLMQGAVVLPRFLSEISLQPEANKSTEQDA